MTVIHKETTFSTMNDAIELLDSCKNLPESFLVIADEQTGGIGRNKTRWHSPKGGLWFTYGFKADGVAHQVTLFIGYCLHKVIAEKYPLLNGRLMIKWPNDLLIDNRKLSGVLAQTYKGYLLIGIGINTNNDAMPTEGYFQPVSLNAFLGFEVSGLYILRSFLGCFLKHYPTFSLQGIAICRSYINDNLFGNGAELDFNNDHETVRGRCKGISDEGALLLEDKEGVISPYFSGSIISERY